MFGLIIGAITAIGKALSVAGLAIAGLKAVGKAVVGLGQKLGSIPPKTDIEEIGEKSLQLEDSGMGFDSEKESYKDYMKRLEEFEIDPEKKHDDEAVVKEGIKVASGRVIEENPDYGKIIESLLKRANDIGVEFNISADQIEQYVDVGAVDEVAAYISGTNKDSNITERAVNAMVDVEKKLEPNISESDAYQKVLGMQG